MSGTCVEASSFDNIAQLRDADMSMSSDATPVASGASSVKAKEDVESGTEVPFEPVYPTGMKLFVIMMAMFITEFAVGLDQTIVASAIPKISNTHSPHFHVRIGQELFCSVWVSVSQAIYQNRLLDGIMQIPGVDVSSVVDAGVSSFRTVVPTDLLPAVVSAAAESLFDVFVAIATLACFGFVATFFIDWKKIEKGTDQENLEGVQKPDVEEKDA
ncbi:hypothetical protein P7C70_g7772, partial [Phenoliferia sp. Uapishka_3]